MVSFFSRSIVRFFTAIILTGIITGLAAFTVIIGKYNYDKSIADLKSKIANTAELAAFSLAIPMWNFDTVTLDGTISAILHDEDVIAIRVEKATKEVAAEKIRESFSTIAFLDLLKNPLYIETRAKIRNEGEIIGEVQIITSTERVNLLIRHTTLLISIFALTLVLVISGFVVYFGKRVLQRPINKLRESADQLASGHLSYEIDTNRKDELGSLAISFDKMRNAIRKKLADLAILNRTGEVMAGIHNQAEALETAIKVMNEQTHVERGSIYILDENNNLILEAFYPDLGTGIYLTPKKFKLSEGVAGQVATTGKLLFLPDVTKTSDYVGSTSGDTPRALLCVPMMDDKTVFGVMNFSGAVGTVEFNEEDEGFALTIARMAVITTKNIRMLEMIAEQNRTLEERILARTAELRQKTNDVNNMLQNMRQGIFTIVSGAVIHPEYSTFLTVIFETNTIADQDALAFLFDNSSVHGDALNQVKETLNALIGEDAMSFEFNSHLLTREFTKEFGDGHIKILELDWNPVLNSHDLIDKLMVTVRDITELKALQLETERQKAQLEVIGQILAVSKDKLLEFIKTSYEFMDENQALIETTSSKNLAVISTLFRNMHTIKGNARTYGLSYVTDSVHDAETIYSRLRTETDYPWNQVELLAQLSTARSKVNHYETVYNEKLAGFTSGEGFDPAVLEKIAHAIDGVDDLSQIQDLQSSLSLIRSSINTLRYVSIEKTLKGIIGALPSIAQQLNKHVPDVFITDNGVRLNKEMVPMLRNVFMHIFRNTMDHGLESTHERIAKGKSEQGKINLEVTLDKNDVMLTFSDDGKGLALGHIYNKAIINGNLVEGEPVSDEQIAELVFLSGLSTAEAVTNVSGRGVGMDAIRKFLNKHRGDVQIAFTGEATTERFRPFQLIITLPARLAVQY